MDLQTFKCVIKISTNMGSIKTDGFFGRSLCIYSLNYCLAILTQRKKQLDMRLTLSVLLQNAGMSNTLGSVIPVVAFW